MLNEYYKKGLAYIGAGLLFLTVSIGSGIHNNNETQPILDRCPEVRRVLEIERRKYIIKEEDVSDSRTKKELDDLSAEYETLTKNPKISKARKDLEGISGSEALTIGSGIASVCFLMTGLSYLIVGRKEKE